jgi:hypothetical protein
LRACRALALGRTYCLPFLLGCHVRGMWM